MSSVTFKPPSVAGFASKMIFSRAARLEAQLLRVAVYKAL
jgi:hypothetical protein